MDITDDPHPLSTVSLFLPPSPFFLAFSAFRGPTRPIPRPRSLLWVPDASPPSFAASSLFGSPRHCLHARFSSPQPRTACPSPPFMSDAKANSRLLGDKCAAWRPCRPPAASFVPYDGFSIALCYSVAPCARPRDRLGVLENGGASPRCPPKLFLTTSAIRSQGTLSGLYGVWGLPAKADPPPLSLSPIDGRG